VVGIAPDRAIIGNSDVDWRVVGIAESLPLRRASFDLGFADWVVEHLASPAAMASEVFRVLRPGGFFIFRTGNLRHYSYAIAGHSPHWFHQLVANPVRGLPRDVGEPYPTYYRMNTCPGVRPILTRAGFVSVSWRGVGRIWPVWKSFFVVAHKEGPAGPPPDILG
jgi:SAM-dependent methyltransferase